MRLPSFSQVHYVWGGLVSTVVLGAVVKWPQVMSWPFATVFLGFLAYHAGVRVFEAFLDRAKDLKP